MPPCAHCGRPPNGIRFVHMVHPVTWEVVTLPVCHPAGKKNAAHQAPLDCFTLVARYGYELGLERKTSPLVEFLQSEHFSTAMNDLLERLTDANAGAEQGGAATQLDEDAPA